MPTGSVVMACARMLHVAAQAVLLREASPRRQRRGRAAGRRAGHQARHHAGPHHLCRSSRLRCVTTLRNSASGLLAAWRLALARIAAKVSMLACRTLHVLAAGAAEGAQRLRHVGHVGRQVDAAPAGSVRASADGRPSATSARRPASARSPGPARSRHRPLATAWRARNSAVEPVEQLLLTLTIGMPVMPTSYSAVWPQVESP